MGRCFTAAILILLAGLTSIEGRTDDIVVPAPDVTPLPPALTEPAPRASHVPPENSLLAPHPKRYKKGLFPHDNQETWDEESVTQEERDQLRKEDRDPNRNQALEPRNLTPAVAEPPAAGVNSAVGETLSSPTTPETPEGQHPDPKWNTGNGRAHFYAGGSQAQTVTSGFRAEHTFWNSLTLSARAEGEIDLLRESNNYSAAGGMTWRLFRPLTLSAEGGAGGATFANWTQFGGALSLLLENLFAPGIDSRLTVRASSGTGTLGSINQEAALLGFSMTTFGVTLQQAISKSVGLSFDADFGSALDADGIDIGAVRAATETDVVQEATHLAQAAMARKFAPMEGSFASTRWNLSVGFRPGNDLRISLEAGQVLSLLEPSDQAAWWTVSPKIEADLSPRTAIQLEALWAPPINPSATESQIFPSDLILGRIGLRLLWP